MKFVRNQQFHLMNVFNNIYSCLLFIPLNDLNISILLWHQNFIRAILTPDVPYFRQDQSVLIFTKNGKLMWRINVLCTSTFFFPYSIVVLSISNVVVTLKIKRSVEAIKFENLKILP